MGAGGRATADLRDFYNEQQFYTTFYRNGNWTQAGERLRTQERRSAGTAGRISARGHAPPRVAGGQQPQQAMSG